jgi:predicted metalloprotease with PDZ domain
MNVKLRWCALALVMAPAGQLWAQNGDGSKREPLILDVDASESTRKIFHVKMTIPVEPGPVTLYFPKWIPGNHGPTGPIRELAGLKWTSQGKPIPWSRDDIDMFTFHGDIPAATKTLHVELDALAGGRMATSTAQMAVIRWNQMLIYPAKLDQREIQVKASLRVPAGWKLGTALPVASQAGDVTHFSPVSLETLIDSPVICGAFFKEVSLGTHDGKPHFMELACDSAAGLEMPEDVRRYHERLVIEAGALFGARHYRSYRFLVTLSNYMGIHGLEHHESSDDGGPEKMLVDKKSRDSVAFVLPHEFVHSWCGKYRRPAGLVTRDFQEPQKTSLLWVYEGLTEYLGTILTARCGLWTPEEARDYLATVAAQMQSHRGRSWRPLVDTAVGAPLNYQEAGGWNAWRRSVDYYDEGTLIWLEADTRIRMLTHGQRSLDDFCRAFFGGESGNPDVKPYTFEDVVAGLQAVADYDWKTFLTERLEATKADAPLGGIAQGGWHLVFTDQPTAFFSTAEGLAKMTDLSSSLGIVLSQEGAIIDVIPGSAADRAHVGPGMKLIAVNTRKWSNDGLKSAIVAAKKSGGHIDLLLESGDYLKTYMLDYHEGEKYPKLERAGKGDDLLTEILKPKRAPASAQPPSKGR